MVPLWRRRRASTLVKSSSRNLTRLGLEALEAREVPAVTLVSGAGGSTDTTGTGFSEIYPPGAVSDDGRYVVFASSSTDLVAGQVDQNGGYDSNDPYAGRDVFLRDTVGGTTTLVSHAVGAAATTGNGVSLTPYISGDGKWIAFYSQATDLINGLTVSGNQLYLYERATGNLTLVTHKAGDATTGATQNDVLTPGQFALSDDGRYVVFISEAYDLLAGQSSSTDVNTIGYPDLQDAFLYDAVNGTLSMVSHTPVSDVQGGNEWTTLVTISGDGSTVLFHSYASNLFTGQDQDRFATELNIFRYDVATDTTSLVTHDPGNPNKTAGVVNDRDDFVASISTDGTRVAYKSYATDLVAGQSDTGGFFPTLDTFLYDATTDTNVLVSRVYGTAATSDASFLSGVSGGPPQISADGNWIAFASDSKNLLSATISGTLDNIFVYNATTGANALVSHADGSLTTTTGGAFPTISNDGAYVAFVGVDATGTFPAAVKYATADGSVAVAGVMSDGSNGSGDTLLAALSGDGSTVVFNSVDPGLVPNDNNGLQDVFVAGSDAPAQPTNLNISTLDVPALPNTGFAQFTTDASPSGRVFQYTLVPGAGSTNINQFTLDPNTGALTTAAQFTVQPTYEIRVRTTDVNYPSVYLEKAFVLHVVNPPTDLATVPLQVLVPASPSTAFAQFVTTGDSGRTFAYSLVSGFGDNALFTIDPSTGALSTGSTFPAPGQSSYSVRVQTTDSAFGVLTYAETFAFGLVNAPADVSLSGGTVTPTADTAAGTLSVPGSDRSFTYSLVSGIGATNNGLFTIVADTLKTASGFPPTVPITYSVRVRATDAAFPSLFTEDTFTVSVQQAPADPVLTVPPATVSALEGAPVALNISAVPGDGTSVVTVTITGVPAGVTFSAGTNNNDGSWTFTQAQLTGLTATVPDDGSFTLTVTATAAFPGGGPTSSVSDDLALAVLNVAPTVLVSAPGGFDPTAPVAVTIGALDPGADTVQSAVINWGDGTVQTVSGVGTFVHQYAVLDRTYEIGVAVTDEDGTFAAPGGVAVDAQFASASQSIMAQLYLNLIGQNASSALLGFGGAMIDAGAYLPMVEYLLGTIEHKIKVVNDLYVQYLGRAADLTELITSLNVLAAGGEPAVKLGILTSDAFFVRAGGTNAAYVQALFPAVLGLAPPDSAGAAQFAAILDFGASRAGFVQSLLNSTYGLLETLNDAYRTYFGRDVDVLGLQLFVPVAVSNPADLTRSIVESPAYIVSTVS